VYMAMANQYMLSCCCCCCYEHVVCLWELQGWTSYAIAAAGVDAETDIGYRLLLEMVGGFCCLRDVLSAAEGCGLTAATGGGCVWRNTCLL